MLSRLSHILSYLFYPLFIPFYGVLLFYIFSPIPFSWPHAIATIAATFVLTILLPIIMLLYLRRKGDIQDLQIHNRQERTVPYLLCAICFSTWAYALTLPFLHNPFLHYIALGATISLFIITIINHWWKISAHLSGIGGLVGAAAAYFYAPGFAPSYFLLSLLLLLSFIMMAARLYLQAHSPLQVCAGWLVGMTTSFLPVYLLF